MEFFSWASATKSAACFRSCANSPLNMTSSASGPKICIRVGTLKSSAALISSVAACCGVSNVLTSDTDVPADETSFVTVCCAADLTDGQGPQTTRPKSQASLYSSLFTDDDFIVCSCTHSSFDPGVYRRRPPPPPRLNPPPPPRDPILEEPRLLPARALD